MIQFSCQACVQTLCVQAAWQELYPGQTRIEMSRNVDPFRLILEKESGCMKEYGGKELRKKGKKELDKISALPMKQRLQYIWDYYWLWIIGIGFFLIFGIWFVWRSTTAIRENWIGIVFPNAMTEVGNGSQLWEEYLEHTGYDIKEKNVLFEDKLYFDPTTASGMNNSYYQAFVAMIETGQADAVTMRREEIEALGKSGRLIDLSSEPCRELYVKYRDRLVYSIPYDTEYSTDPVPIGIDVSDSILMTKYHIYENSCVFSIGSYTRNLEACTEFLDWILEGKSGSVAQKILEAETETEAG